MNIIAINGSPRKSGRINQIVNEIMEGARENGHLCEHIYLSDLDLKDCTGCMACQEQGQCVIRDGIVNLENAIKKADVIIWASPTRWANVSGYMLRAIERLFGFLIRERPKGTPVALNAKNKKAILVTACSTPYSIDWLFNESRANFSRMGEMCKYSGQKIIKKFVLPGTASMKEIPQKHLLRARKIGHNIS